MEPIKPIKRYAAMADPQARPRYTGIPTFFRVPYAEDLAAVDLGIIGVPFDGGVTNRAGTRHGPREVRNQSSLMRKLNPATGTAPVRRHPRARSRRLLDRGALCARDRA